MSTATRIIMPVELERDILAIIGLNQLPQPLASKPATIARQPARLPHSAFAPARITQQAIPQIIALVRSRAASTSLVGAGVLAFAAGVVVLIGRVPDWPNGGSFGVPAATTASAIPTATLSMPARAPIARPMAARKQATSAPPPPSSPTVASSELDERPRQIASRVATSVTSVPPDRLFNRRRTGNQPRRQASQPVPAKELELATHVVGPIAVAPAITSPFSGSIGPGEPSGTARVSANAAPLSVSAPIEQLASGNSAALSSLASIEHARRTRNDSLDRLRSLRRQ